MILKVVREKHQFIYKGRNIYTISATLKDRKSCDGVFQAPKVNFSLSGVLHHKDTFLNREKKLRFQNKHTPKQFITSTSSL